MARVKRSDGKHIAAGICDLSAGGASITGPTTGLAVGDEVELTLLFPMNNDVRYRCEVRHITPEQGFGVKFLL